MKSASARRWLAIAAAVTVTTLLLAALSRPSQAADTRSLSRIFDTSQPYTVIAALPDAAGFMKKLREGEAMRAFFDSPLGLHFLRSAPLRSAAHLHRFISLAPRSWQWNLYTLITDGPVFYRSHAGQFTLVIALNKKGKVITSLVKEANAARVDDWLVIASNRATLDAQLAYMKAPQQRDSALDSLLSRASAIAVSWKAEKEKAGKRSLLKALLTQSLGLAPDNSCQLLLQPEANSIAVEGECTGYTGSGTPGAAETLTMKDFPGYVYFRPGKDKNAHLMALGGLTTDFGYLIPRLFYTGPVSDQKSLEFLSQAFKTRKHILETKDGAMQVRYPYPYTYSDRKYDLFAPYLTANRERFFWHSFLQQDQLREVQLELKPEYNLYASLKVHALVKNSETALRQFDALYSPGHFNEFRDALFKSLPSLRNTALTIYSRPKANTLRIGGAITFADT